MKTLLNYIKKIIKANSYSITLAEMKVEEFLKYAQTNGTLSKDELQIAKIIANDMIDKITAIDKYDVTKAMAHFEKRNPENYAIVACHLSSSCGLSSDDENDDTNEYTLGSNCDSSSKTSCGGGSRRPQPKHTNNNSYSSGCGTSGGRGC